MNNFCTEAGLTNPKCVSVQSYDFSSEEQIFDILLDVLKSELPTRLALIKDCDGKPMYIDEKAIDLLPAAGPHRFEIMLNPLGDIPTYSANLIYRTVVYNFEIVLTVTNTKAECITWELVRFKNVLEGLLIGAEFVIDGYDSVDIEPKGFNYYVPTSDGGSFFRQGSYRFSVTVTQYKIN